MKIINNSKDITTLEVDDKVIFGDLEYKVCHRDGYFLYGIGSNNKNDKIFTILGLSAKDFIKNLGIETLPVNWIFPEVKSLEVLTAIVSALFKEYEKQNELPKTWEEFCKRNVVTRGESYISIGSDVEEFHNTYERDSVFDRNICTSAQEAEAHLALMQLLQLRKVYVKDWEPDWENEYEGKYCINLVRNKFKIDKYWEASHVLSFPIHDLANQFLTNFKDLLEIAKPVL